MHPSRQLVKLLWLKFTGGYLMRARSYSRLVQRAVAIIFVIIAAVIAPAAATSGATLLNAAPASAGVIEPSSLSLTLDLTGPDAWQFGQSFDGYLLVSAPGIPVPAELGSADGRTVVSVTPVPPAACRSLPALFAGSTASGHWCLRLAGLHVGTTVQGIVTSPDAQLTLQVSARDPIVPLPLLVTFLGLLAGTLMLLLSPERLAPWLRRWSLYAKLDKNSNAARSGRSAITGIDRNKIRSLTAANGRPLDHDASFVEAVLEVLEVGPAQLISAREKLGEVVSSAAGRQPLTASPLLNRAITEAANRGASWSDFFDDTGNRLAKLPPTAELDRLTFAIGLLDDLDYLRRQIPRERSADIIIATRFNALRAEIGQAGGAPDVDRALKAAEAGIQLLRAEIRYDVPEVGYAHPEWSGDSYYGPPDRAGVGGRVLPIVLFLVALAGLTAPLVLAGHLKIILIAGMVIAGIIAAILVLWGAVKATPFLKRSAKWVYRRVFRPLARGIALRLGIWRYTLLRDFVSMAVIAVLTLFGGASVLVTVYTGRAAFGTPLDYVALALAAATVSVVATICGYLTDRFRSRIPKT
jgi:hypothetical protein